MFKCPKCDMKFDEEKRLGIHLRTHNKKNKKQKFKNVKPDFEKPDFSHIE